MKTNKKIITASLIIFIVVVGIATIKYLVVVDSLRKDFQNRDSMQLSRFSDMEFNGVVVKKQTSTDSSKGFYIRVKYFDFNVEQEWLMPCKYYEINTQDSIVLCRTAEEEYNTFQIGDSIVKKKGIENAFQRITDN